METIPAKVRAHLREPMGQPASAGELIVGHELLAEQARPPRPLAAASPGESPVAHVDRDKLHVD